MPTEINKPKVLHELLMLRFYLEEYQKGGQFRRLSPATKDVHAMLVQSVVACAEAVRNGHPLMFEINIWEEQTLTGWAIDFKEREDE